MFKIRNGYAAKKCANFVLGLIFGAHLYLAGFAEEIASPPIELEIFYYGWADGQKYSSDWPIEIKASEITGIHLRNVTPQEVFDGEIDVIKSLVTIMGSKNVPDIIGGANLREKFYEFGLQGALVNLDPLIDKHAPNIRAYFDQNPQYYKATKAPDGLIYHIPYIQDGEFSKGFFIRQDWLDKLGLDVPDTVNELHDVLLAFKNQDPNGNGLADELPYFAKTTWDLYRLAWFWDAEGFGSEIGMNFYLDENLVKHGFVSSEFKTALGELAKWYEEGLFDPKIFEGDHLIREKNLTENTGGMTLDWFGSTAEFNDKLKLEIPGFEFLPILPPKSVSGRRFAEVRRENYRTDGWAITYENEYPIETIKYFDFWFSEEGRRLHNFGVEGQTYDLIGGKPIFKPEVLNQENGVARYMTSIGGQIPKGVVQDFDYERQWLNDIALRGIEMYSEHLDVPDLMPPLTFTIQQQRVYNRYWPEIRSHMQRSTLNWIWGKGNVHEEWDEYIAELDRLGFQEVLTLVNEAYCAQYCD